MENKYSLNQVQPGQQFQSSVYWHNGEPCWYVSTVLSVQPVSKRFAKPDRIVEVQVKTNTGIVIDSCKQLWYSQLQQGLT